MYYCYTFLKISFFFLFVFFWLFPLLLSFFLFLNLFCVNLPCSGMFRNVPECSGMFHVPGFVDALISCCVK